MGLIIISIFKCKRHYRSHVLREILEKAMLGEIISHFGGVLYFMYILCIPHVICLQIATLTQSMLSTMSMTAGDTSQTAMVQITHACMPLCFIVLHKLCVSNFKSCRSLTCYMVCVH